MGHAAAVVGGRWGAVSPRAQAGGGRREAVDQPRRSVEQAVARAPSRGPCDDEGCADCIVPRKLLQSIALDRARQAHVPIVRVEIDDPRERG